MCFGGKGVEVNSDVAQKYTRFLLLLNCPTLDVKNSKVVYCRRSKRFQSQSSYLVILKVAYFRFVNSPTPPLDWRNMKVRKFHAVKTT